MTRFGLIFRSSGARSAALLASFIGCAASCSSDEQRPRGQVMLAVDTDLHIDHDMNQVGVEVFSQDGALLSMQDLDILPVGDVALPGTLGLVPSDAGGQVVRVKVTAKRQSGAAQEVRVVRQAIVKVPTDRVALLRMPLHWLCDLSNKSAYNTACGDDETCKAGVCVSADVDGDALPDYSPADVFGGGDPQGNGSHCLDVQRCFADPKVLKRPSPDDCSVPLPDGADLGSLNVAMVLPPKTDGHCLPDPLTGEKDAGTCFMPLDHDPDDGFSVDKGRIVLPAAACQRKSVTGIAISQSCKTKELPIPICGPWNGWKAPASGDGGAAGAPPSLSQAGESSVAQGGASGGVGGESQGGNLGLAGETGSCPVPAELAPAYYYVLLDGSRAMQSIATIRQAIEQFTNEAASANVQFGLQVADHTCSDADFSQPVIDFTSLPLEASALPNLQPGATNELLLDSALGQSLDVLQGAGETGSKTLVVITGGVDQACGTSADLMHQTLTNALNAGVSLRPLLIRGNDAPTPAVVSGLSTAGTPTPVQLAGSSLQAAAVVSYLEQFRDTLGPCTYLAPSASKYTVQLAPADGPAQTLSAVESSAQCSLQRSTYYKQGQMLVLCPSTCASKGAAELQTDECSAVANGGTSSTAGAGGSNTAGSGASAGFGAGGAPFSRCPTTKPATGTTCTVSMTCPYTDSSCSCNEKTWSCQ